LTGQFPTNLVFVGEQGKTVYVTMQKRGSIEYLLAYFHGQSHALLSRQQPLKKQSLTKAQELE
jgi:sugar lactone lactonase YvrE